MLKGRFRARTSLRIKDPWGIFAADEGFSTLGMVLALLVTLSLLFTTAQVYRVQTASASVQNVADAAALAAENPVAEFYVIVRVCDALALSMTLAGVVVTGVGMVALCVPPIAATGESLMETGRSIFSSRDTFVEKAASALERVQRMLPYASAAEALATMRANSDEANGFDYVGFSVLLPGEGEDLAFESPDAREALETTLEEQDAVKEAARRAEDAAAEANALKAEGFAADCGNNPGYCMYERAGSLAGLSGSSNPLYASVDAWSFSVALARARAYYAARSAQERPEGSSVEEQARSALRSRFYAYAQSELASGYVEENDFFFDAHFPLLPRNTDEMRATSLYTEAVYPITTVDGASVMHAWSGCPEASGAQTCGSIAQMEAEGFGTCPSCSFSASSLGSVAAASTSIENGFEYHYRRVAEAAEAYEQARAVCDPLKREVQERLSSSFESLSRLVESSSARIDARPPGRFGAVVLVANVGRTPADAGFVSSFVASSRALGVRAAVSAATLASDSAEEGESVLTALLDGVSERFGGLGSQVGELALGVWSAALGAYANGYEAVRDGLESALGSLPLASASGLGQWAADALSSFLERAGLQPAILDAPKPVLVNTVHVVSADDGAFAQRYRAVRQQALEVSGNASGDLFSAVVASVEEKVVDGLESWDATFELARIEPLGPDGPSVPIEIVVPRQVVAYGVDAVKDFAQRIKGIVGSITGARQWE